MPGLSITREVRRYGIRALAVVGALGVWELMSRSGLVAISLFPPPSRVFVTLGDDLRSGAILPDIAASLRRVFVGFAAGSAAGIILGVLTGLWEAASLTVGQVLQLLRPIPPISIVPLVILWIGIGEPMRWFLVAFGVLFPVWVATHSGIRQVLPTYIWTAKSMGATGITLVRTVYIPAAMPFLLAGLRTALAIAFFCLVAAEGAGAVRGIMYQVQLAHDTFRIDRMLEGIMLLGFLSASLDGILMLALRHFTGEGRGLADAD